MDAKSLMRVIFASWLTLPVAASVAWGDGGALRYSERRGDRVITVFTAPTPLRCGPVDISVLVQDSDSGKPLTDVPIVVHAELVDDAGSKGRSLDARATSEAATNKLLSAAELDLSKVGRWRIEVSLPGFEQGSAIHFDVDVAEGLPPWAQTSFWIVWPLAAIGFFAIHQWLVRRKNSGAIRRMHRTVNTPFS